MAMLFWTLLMLYPFMVYCQSGDDEDTIDIECWSLLTLQKSSLVCVLTDDDVDICEKVALLCSPSQKGVAVCSNATMEGNSFTFWNLSPLSHYTLHIYLSGGRQQTQNFELFKIVKITTPEIENAVYKLDGAIIGIKYTHDYVMKPDFQLEFWGDHSNNKEKVIVKYKQMSIGGDKLRDSEIYNVRVRAKPVDFFKGMWTEWSTVKSFKVNHAAVKGTRLKTEGADHLSDIPPFLYVLLFILPCLFVVGILIQRWKKEIQACVFPDVPDPKATLAQIHRQKEHLPMSFSPEIFKDINIYPVICTEEKQFVDDQHDTTESCDDEVVALKCSRPASMCKKQDNDDQSLDSETSQIKIKLLDECASADDIHDNPGCQSVSALQRYSKDESYVTMSSLYKTQ